MAINKVEYGGNTLIDLTQDTVTASDILSGVTAHGANGELITGTIESVSTLQPDLTDLVQARSASYGGMGPTTLTVNKYVQKIRLSSLEFPIPAMATAEPANVLDGLTFYDTDLLHERTGTMPNIGSLSETIDPGDTYTIPEGYHDGTGTVTATGGGTLAVKQIGARLQLGVNYSSRNSSVLDTEVEDGTISAYFYMDQDSATGYVQGSHDNSSWSTLYSRNTDGACAVTSFSGYRYYRLRISGTKTSGNWLVGAMAYPYISTMASGGSND